MRLSIVLALLLLVTIVAGGPRRKQWRMPKRNNRGQNLMAKVVAARSRVCKVMIGTSVKKDAQCINGMTCDLERSLCNRNKKVYVCRKPVSTSAANDTQKKSGWIKKKIVKNRMRGQRRRIVKKIIKSIKAKPRQKKVVIRKKSNPRKGAWKKKFGRRNKKKCKTTTPSMRTTTDSNDAKSSTATPKVTDATVAETTVNTTTTTTTTTNATHKATEATPVVTTEDVDLNNKFKNT